MTRAKAERSGAEAAVGQAPVGAQSTAPGWKLPGFGPEARVLTTIGEVPAKLLRRNDQIVTPSGQSCAIEWIDRVGLDAAFFQTVPGAAPVVLRADALGPGVPARDLTMSRMQTVVTGTRLQDMRTAEELCEEAGPAEGSMTYTMFHCGRPVLARVDGVWCRVDEISARKGRRAV